MVCLYSIHLDFFFLLLWHTCDLTEMKQSLTSAAIVLFIYSFKEASFLNMCMCALLAFCQAHYLPRFCEQSKQQVVIERR